MGLRAEGDKRAQTGQKVRLQEGVQESAKGDLFNSHLQISGALLHNFHLQELLLQARLQVHGRPQGVLLQSSKEDQKDQVRQLQIILSWWVSTSTRAQATSTLVTNFRTND